MKKIFFSHKTQGYLLGAIIGLCFAILIGIPVIVAIKATIFVTGLMFLRHLPYDFYGWKGMWGR